MTEQEWATSQDPRAMLEFITPGESRGVGKLKSWMASDRKLRLWVKACREAVHQGRDTWIDLDGPDQPMNSAKTWATHTGEHVGLPFSVRAHLLREVIGNPHNPVIHSVGLPGSSRMHRVGGHCIPDFWLTPAVVEMAKYAYDNRDFSNLPVIADALEEAGCMGKFCKTCNATGYSWGSEGKCAVCLGSRRLPNPLLEHLRGTEPHVHGCWALDLLLGLE